MRIFRLTTLACVAAALMAMPANAKEVHRIGLKIDGFALKSPSGKEYHLNDFKQEALVAVFLGTECPMAKLYGPRLAQLARELDTARVAFLGIDSNRQDSLEKISDFATRYKIDFPILKDPGNVIADRFHATRTPEVFLLDKDRIVRYRGRIDDRYGFGAGVGYQRTKPSREDLAEAIRELLAGKRVSLAETEPLGCLIGRMRQPTEGSAVTYSNQIARLFQDKCVECHRPGRIGPFAMTSYQSVVGWGDMIREVVEQKRMPPWHADSRPGAFANDISLSDAERQLIVAWVENGCPEGDPANLPHPKQYTEGWQIGKPDQILYMREDPVDVQAEGVMDYFYIPIDPGWKEDKWIKASEARPDSLETVHHILVFVLPPAPKDPPRRRQGFEGLSSGAIIAEYGPGGGPLINSEGKTAIYVPAGSRLVFNVHYTPNGTPHRDRSCVGFKFADPKEVEQVARSTALMDLYFHIPPGASKHQATAVRRMAHDTRITNVMPHMHKRGAAFRFEATMPDGATEVLLDVPRYDFNWQTVYQFKQPKLLPKGASLKCTATWDNSGENLSNPNSRRWVGWGEQTEDEMMVGFYVELFPKGQLPKEPSGGQGEIDPHEIFARWDINRDGKLARKEMPTQLPSRFSRVDTNHDGWVSEDELTRELVKHYVVRGRN